MSAGITYTAAKVLLQAPVVNSKSTRMPSDNVPDHKGIRPLFGRIKAFSPVAPPGWKPPFPLCHPPETKSVAVESTAEVTSTESASPTSNPAAKYGAFTVGIGIESAIAQGLTSSRFNIQRNAINSTSIKSTLKDLFKGYQFFSVARLSQFFSMTEAKEWGKDFSKTYNPNASQSTHDLVGAAASSASGVLFGLPMELVLLEGVKSTHEGAAFSLKDTVKMSDTVRLRARGAGATALRDLPLGGFLVLGAPKIEEALTQFAQDYISAPVIKVVSVLASAAGFCVSTQGADVVKTTIQNNKQLPDKTWDVARQIYEERGIKAFKSGLCPRFSKVATTFLIFNIGVAKLEEGLSKGNF